MQIPVFAINGFLESGKTNFMKFTIKQEYFRIDDPTLLIVCEEGEEEYEEDFLKRHNTVAVYIDEFEDFTVEKLTEYENKFKPARVLIEWNGLWMQDKMILPQNWFLHQMISIFDTSILQLYLKNMKPFMGAMLKDTELIICNRADGIEEEVLSKYHLELRAMSQKSEIVFEGAEGEIRGDFSIELPYDLDQDVVAISPEYYGIFYLDSMERADKYRNKVFEFSAQVLKSPMIEKNTFVPVRLAMTCCEEDMKLLGHICYYDKADTLKDRDWVKVRAKLVYEYNKAYEGEGPVFYAEKVVFTSEIKEYVSFSF